MTVALRVPLGLLGRALPPVALAGCLWLLAGRLAGMDLAGLGPAFADMGLATLGLAALCTGLGFGAVAGFETMMHRILGIAGPRARARRAGVAAVAIGQTAGFGALTGALVRWRMLPDLGFLGATQVSVAVSLAFIACLGTLAGLAQALLRMDLPLVLAIAAVVGAVTLRLAPGRRTPGLNPARGLALLGWALADVAAGAATLAVLLPATALPGPGAFLAAYLVALMAGFLSQSPGGLGAFELALIALLPEVPQAPLLAALLGYRVIYHLVPALVGVALLVPRPVPLPAPGLVAITGAARDRALARAPQGDWALALQGAEMLMTRDHAAGWLVRRLGSRLVTIGTPRGAADPAGLCRHARDGGLEPLFYKADGRTALRARRDGLCVLRIGREAWIDPVTWTTDAPASRGLRRKLRGAAAAGLRIEAAPDSLPLMQMATVAALWANRNGGENGFSMGRFDPVLLRHAVVVLAWHEGRLAGFVSFNRTNREWALDLMRLSPQAPDGAMFALVAGGIAQARAQGVRRLSLAAVPLPPVWVPDWAARPLSRPGLLQFKSAFAPRWRPLYLAAPSAVQALTGSIALARAIHHPGPLPLRPAPPPQPGHAQNRFEIDPAPCHAQADAQPGGRGGLAAGARQNKGPDHDQRPLPPA